MRGGKHEVWSDRTDFVMVEPVEPETFISISVFVSRSSLTKSLVPHKVISPWLDHQSQTLKQPLNPRVRVYSLRFGV